jgi:predicted ATPase
LADGLAVLVATHSPDLVAALGRRKADRVLELGATT